MKKLTSLLLAALLVIISLPCTVWAAGGEYTVDAANSFDSCWNKARADKGTVKLMKNVDLAKEYVLEDGETVTLDLNGFTIRGTGDNADYLFIIEDGRLVITDSSENAGGTIVIAKKGEDYDAMIYVDEDGTLVLDKGTLLGNDDEDCRLVEVDEGCFELYSGGKLTGNVYDGDGAAIYINEGLFKMYGGIISDNTAMYGGAIYFDGGSRGMLLQDGEICGNHAVEGGGAIYLDDGTASVTGGIFRENKAKIGGAIYASTTCDGLRLSGDVLITDNEATYSAPGSRNSVAGGGVDCAAYVPMLTGYLVRIGGSARIYGNTPCDLYTSGEDGMIVIEDDIDLTPENHAWVGLAAPLPLLDDYELLFNPSRKDPDYTVCFFGNTVPHASDEIYALQSGDNEPVLYIDSTVGDLTSMKLNANAMRDKTGALMTEDEDYICYYNESDLSYSIYAKKGMYIDEHSRFLVTERSAFKSLELVKIVTDSAEGMNFYLLYYLCRNERSTGTSVYYRDVYYTVTVAIDTYTVDYVMNGHGTAVESETVENGSLLRQPADPSEDGMIFDGWFADKELTEPFDFGDPITADTTVYARWSLPVYKLRFELNGHGETLDDQSVTAGQKALKPADPSEDGWSFGGWFADRELTEPFSFDTAFSGDVTVYALWTEIPAPPATGDSSLLLWAGLLTLSLAAAVTAAAAEKKRRAR